MVVNFNVSPVQMIKIFCDEFEKELYSRMIVHGPSEWTRIHTVGYFLVLGLIVFMIGAVYV